MNGHGKSDRPVVPAKPPNKAAAAEAAEERGLAKGNADGRTRPGRSAGPGVPSGLDRVRKWHEGIRTRGSPRCCTMSAWTGW